MRSERDRITAGAFGVFEHSAAVCGDGFDREPPVQIVKGMKEQRGLFADARNVLKVERIGFKHAGKRTECVDQAVRNAVDVLSGDRVGQQKFENDVVGHTAHALRAIRLAKPFPMPLMNAVYHAPILQ